jgi:hypothetical protein
MLKTRARKPLGLESLPKEMRTPLLNLMHDHKIDDVEEGLVRMAQLAYANNKMFEDLVQKEAEKRYRSRHFIELNKAMATIQKDALARAETARQVGWSEAHGNYAISYPCCVCGGLIYMRPNQEEHRAVIGFLRENGWAHGACLKK